MQGIILINKPQGPTSFGVVAKVRKLSNQKRVGHTGTLDPMAKGVLPVLLGRATALSDYVLCADKTYYAVCMLGITTDTYDITGEKLSEATPIINTEQLKEVLDGFRGKIMQVPPAFSAIKKDGKKMYELARKGKEVAIPPREVEIKSISLEYFDGEKFGLNVTCSKGTYIRSLCHDIGQKLGCGATLCELVRTDTAGFSLSQCVDLDALNESNIQNYIQNEDAAVAHLPFVNVTRKQANRFGNGGALDLARVNYSGENGTLLRIKFEDTLVGIGVIDCGEIKIKCVINNISLGDTL